MARWGGARRAHSQFPSPVARSVGHSARLCTMFGHFVRMHFREIDGGAVDREIRPASHGPMGGGPTGKFTVSQPRGAVRWSFRAALHDVRTLCEDAFSGNRRGGRRSRDTAGEPWPDGGVARRAHSQFPSPVARSVGHSARLCTMFGHFVRMHFREIDGGAVDREIRPASHGPMGGGPTGTFTVSQPRGAVRWSFRAALHDVRTLCEDAFSGNRRGGRRSRDTAGEPWPDGGGPDGHIHSFPAPWRGPLVIPRGSARCSDTL
jgi:hypothetical protein